MPDSIATLSGRAASSGQEPYLQLREAILHGDILPGQHLAENALAKSFKVSRTPIREALTRLEQDGLVVRDGMGLSVRDPSPAEILDSYDMWILLEGEVSRVAAERRTTNDLLVIKRAQRRYIDERESDGRTKVAANRLFHHMVWEAAHHESLQWMLQRLEFQLGRFPLTTLDQPGRWDESVEQHNALVDAIERRDGDAAFEIGREHFLDARRLRVRLLEDSM